MNNLSILIHGPIGTQWMDRIAADINAFRGTFDKILVVAYAADFAAYVEICKDLKLPIPIEFVQCKDLLNPGFFNINRQLATVRAGLSRISEETLVVKLRNDQTVDFNELYKRAKNLPKGKILSTNCFTRLDRLYHPSDMLLCGHKNDLDDYFSAPMMRETHLQHILQAQKDYIDSNYTQTALKTSPESYLFRNFINSKGWTILETHDDSLLSLKRYIFLVDSWDIKLRWKQKRTPFLPAGSIILPHYFTMRPFESGPIETCRCINSHFLLGRRASLKACFYIALSRLLFALRKDNRLRRRLTLKAKVHFLKLGAKILKCAPKSLQPELLNKLNYKIMRNTQKYKTTI